MIVDYFLVAETGFLVWLALRIVPRTVGTLIFWPAMLATALFGLAAKVDPRIEILAWMLLLLTGVSAFIVGRESDYVTGSRSGQASLL